MADHAIHQLMRVPCTIHHSDPGVADAYGDRAVEVVTDSDVRCYIAQSTRSESDEIEVERWNIYFLPDAVIDANDSVDVHGMTLQLVGNPWVVIDPVTGFLTHIEATAVRRR